MDKKTVIKFTKSVYADAFRQSADSEDTKADAPFFFPRGKIITVNLKEDRNNSVDFEFEGFYFLCVMKKSFKVIK